MPATVKIYAWVLTPNDTRDTASSTVSFEASQKFAVQTARRIDRHGMAATEAANRGIVLPPGHSIAAGHGVRIVYPSGRARVIFAD